LLLIHKIIKIQVVKKKKKGNKTTKPSVPTPPKKLKKRKQENKNIRARNTKRRKIFKNYKQEIFIMSLIAAKIDGNIELVDFSSELADIPKTLNIIDTKKIYRYI